MSAGWRFECAKGAIFIIKTKIIMQGVKFTDTTAPMREIPDPVAFLKSQYQRGCIFGLDNLKRSGRYREMGWEFDFRPYMKKFLVKQYGQWSEEWAPNRTAIRNSTYGTIQAIQQLL